TVLLLVATLSCGCSMARQHGALTPRFSPRRPAWSYHTPSGRACPAPVGGAIVGSMPIVIICVALSRLYHSGSDGRLQRTPEQGAACVRGREEEMALCSRCRHANPEGAKFCNGCGAKLEETCPACGQVNPPGSRFCNACGTPLTQQPAGP